MTYESEIVLYSRGCVLLGFSFESLATCAHVLFALWGCCLASYWDCYSSGGRKTVGVIVRGVELIFFFYCVSFHSVHFVTLRVFGVHIVHCTRFSFVVWGLNLRAAHRP